MNKNSIIKINENDLHGIVKDAVQSVINESLSQRAYHFTTFSKFYNMVDTDTIAFSKIERFDKLNSLGDNGKSKYFLSATRVRGSRFGYSYKFNTRIELNADKFNANFRAKPVSFFHSSVSDKMSVKHKYNHNLMGYGDSDPDSEIFWRNQVQHDNENEDRIFSNEPEIHNIERYITRVDILFEGLIDPTYLRSHEYGTWLALKELYNSKLGTKIFIYNNRKEFDRQGKNITLQVINSFTNESIERNVKSAINEILSRNAYHFTSLEYFSKIAISNVLKASPVLNYELKSQFGNQGKNKWYISATRVRDSRFGFSEGFSKNFARIELNTDAFNANYQSRPVNYFINVVDDETVKQSFTHSSDGFVRNTQVQPEVENEDRIFLRDRQLDNADRYINRVDILIDVPSEDILNMELYHNYTWSFIRNIIRGKISLDKIYFYNDEKSFNKQENDVNQLIWKLFNIK